MQAAPKPEMISPHTIHVRMELIRQNCFISVYPSE